METKNLQPNLEAIEKDLSNEKQRITRNMVKRQATPEHNPSKKKGIGFTRKNKDQSKKARKIAKFSRKINRGK